MAGQERFFKEWRDLACDQGRRARRAKERSERMAGRRSWGKEESRRRGKRRERKRGEGGVGDVLTGFYLAGSKIVKAGGHMMDNAGCEHQRRCLSG